MNCPRQGSWLALPTFDRRTFVQQFLLGTVTSLLAGKICSARVLGSIIAGPAGVLKVKVSDYPALAQPGGSIQLYFSGSSAHPLMVNRGAGDTFYAMDSDCQHAHCVVGRYNASTGTIVCGCHGSQYAIDGSLVGGPAARGLNTFASTFDGVDTLRVSIPGLAFRVTEVAVEPAAQTPKAAQTRKPLRRKSSAVPASTSKRVRLKANILPYSTYRVYFQPELIATPQIVPFSTTATGAATVTSAFTTTTPVTLYVDAPGDHGFYTIALVARPF